MISVIIPAYNEEKRIAETIRALRDFFDAQDQDFELVVVSDGSYDGTYEAAKSLEDEKVRVFSYPDNRGKGHALRYGFERSRGDRIVFFDAGLNFPPRQVLEFLERLNGGRAADSPKPGFGTDLKAWLYSSAAPADIVIGSKRHPDSEVDYPWRRKLVSLGAQATVKILFNLDITDTQVGLKVFRREVLEKIMPLVLVKRYAFDIELLALAQRYGFKIIDAPVKLRLKLSTAVSPRSLYVTLFDTLAVFYRLRVLKFYDLTGEEREKLLANYPVTLIDKVLCFILGDLLGRKS